MNILTGYRAEPHYSGQQMRDENIALYGTGTYILNVGSQMAATVVSANEVSIADGLVVAEGCTAEIARGTAESIIVENGEQSMLRKDLIVLRYTKDVSTNIEDMQLHIIKGTSASANPTRPAYTSGSIADGDTFVEFPLYEVNISGITIQSVVLLAGKKALADKNTVDDLSAKIGTGTLATVAKNIIGAINELLPKINANTSNLADARTRVARLESKGDGIVGSETITVNAGGTSYVQLGASSSYIVLVGANALDNALRGAYLVGVNGEKHIGIKAINKASSVEIIDAGSVAGNYTGVMRVRNNGGTSLRVTIITTFGTAV